MLVLGITFTFNSQRLGMFPISKAVLGGSSLFFHKWIGRNGAASYDDRLLIIVQVSI
jgi:hypothetical protein